MGIFDFEDAFNQIADGMMGEFSNALKEAEVNQKRPSVTSLTFMPVPAMKAAELKKENTGLFGGGFLGGLFGGGSRKKLADSIEEGRTTYAEVLVLARLHRVVDRSEDSSNVEQKYFYKMADLNGTVIREDAPMIDDKFSVALDYNSGNSASDTDCSDVVDPKGYQHMILLHYYLKDDQYYVLLTKEQYDDLTILADHAGASFHFVEDGVGYKW